MPVVERFDRELIERYLRGYDISYTRNNTGDFTVKFDYDGAVGGTLSMLFAATGAQQSVYAVTVVCSRTVARNAWGKAVAHCNEWNQDKRWPRAYLYVEHPTSDVVGHVMLDESIDLGPGIHWELFERWTSLMILSSHEFWKWAHGEKGL